MAIKRFKIKKIIRKAQSSLKLASHKVDYSLKRDMDKREYGEITWNSSKRKVLINLNSKRLHNDLEDTIIHELLHLFLSKYLGVAENVFERQKKFKSLKKYQKGEEEAIRILASLIKRSIFPKRKRRRYG